MGFRSAPGYRGAPPWGKADGWGAGRGAPSASARPGFTRVLTALPCRFLFARRHSPCPRPAARRVAQGRHPPGPCTLAFSFLGKALGRGPGRPQASTLIPLRETREAAGLRVPGPCDLPATPARATSRRPSRGRARAPGTGSPPALKGPLCHSIPVFLSCRVCVQRKDRFAWVRGDVGAGPAARASERVFRSRQDVPPPGHSHAPCPLFFL